MKRQLDRKRFEIGSWYIGAGNKPSVFTRRPRQAFGDLKELYQQHLGDSQSSTIDYEKLTEQQKQVIRQQVKMEYQRTIRKKILSGFIAIFLTVGVLILLVWLLTVLYLD